MYLRIMIDMISSNHGRPQCCPILQSRYSEHFGMHECNKFLILVQRSSMTRQAWATAGTSSSSSAKIRDKIEVSKQLNVIVSD